MMSRMGRSARWFTHRSWLSKRAQESVAVKDLAQNYVAGESTEEVIAEAMRLDKQGLALGFGYLPDDEREETTTGKLIHLLEQLPATGHAVDLSVKPSTLGLRSSEKDARRRLGELCAAAAQHGASVTLEIQHLGEQSATIDLYRELAADHPLLGLTLPVNARRSERDCEELAAEGARIRVCIGSYPATRNQGFVSEQEKSLALVRCLRILMESEAYPMLATHDPRMIDIAQELARRNEREADSYEFQMFYGVRPFEQRRLVDIGLRCRTYIPFGPAWYEYLATRIAARPRMLGNYARALLDKR